MVTFAKEALVNIGVRLLGSHEGPEKSGLIPDFCSSRVVIKLQLSPSVVKEHFRGSTMEIISHAFSYTNMLSIFVLNKEVQR